MNKLLAFVLLALIVVACDALPSATTPAPEAPTAFLSTPLPTTIATPVRLPTAIITPSLAPPTPSPINTALKKTQDAQTYRANLQMNVKSASAPPFVLNLKGEIAKADSHYAYQLGAEQVELTTLNGQFFVKGARTLGLPSATKWYIVTPDLADAARAPFTPEDILDDFIAQAGNAKYQTAARESLDGQNCQIWQSAPKTFAETGISALLGGGLDTSPFGVLDQAEVKLWLCDDGLAHQLSVTVDAHNTRRANEKGNAQLILRLQDFGNAAIKIVAPTGAEQFKIRAPTP
jgi:hypothetical protein